MKSIKTSWKQIRRTPYQALTAVLTMMLTFLTISIFSLIFFGSSVVLNFFESRPQIAAFFNNDTKQEHIDQIAENLRRTGKVSNIKFVSKEEALKIYKEQNKKRDPLLLELVNSDILPPSLEISTNNISDLVPIAEELKKSPYITDVVLPEDVVQTLKDWTNGARLIGTIIITLLSLVSIFIMMMVIGFKVSQKRDEIEIMRLLSASKWYIRFPFMLEGILYGATGAIVGWLIAVLGLLYASPGLEKYFTGVPLFPISPIFLFSLLLVELLIAVGLGILASFLAVLRYLK